MSRARLRTVFIGTDSDFSAVHLSALMAAHEVLWVHESVRRERGLGRLWQRLRPSRLRRLAARAGAGHHLLGSAGTARLERQLHALRPDLLCVVGMRRLLPAALLNLPRLGTLNLHPSLLPAYRGPEPVFWQVADEVREGGVTAHLLDAGEDTGPILAQSRFLMPEDASYRDIVELALAAGPPALLEAIDALAGGRAAPRPQPQASPARRARRLRPEDQALLDLHGLDLAQACRRLRRLGPRLDRPPPDWRHPGCRPYVRAAEPGDPGAEPGRVARDAAGWYLAHPEGRLRLDYLWEPRAWIERMLRRG